MRVWVVADSLKEFLNRYAREHDITACTRESYRIAVQRYEGWITNHIDELNGLPELKTLKLTKYRDKPIPMSVSLNREVLNCFLQSLGELGRAKHTIASYRRQILVLWRDAYDVDLCKDGPKRIREIRAPETPKDVWTPEEVTGLIDACSCLKGRYRSTRIRKSAYYESIIRAAWDSSLRLGDLLLLRLDKVATRLDLEQHKTGRMVDIQFQPETLDAIDDTLDMWTPSRSLVWPLWARRERFYAQMRKIVAEAGLSGTFKKLRRSSVTDVERQGGPGWEQAGHSNPTTTARWYLNRALAYEDRQRPAPLPRTKRRGA
jgi:integrase